MSIPIVIPYQVGFLSLEPLLILLTVYSLLPGIDW